MKSRLRIYCVILLSTIVSLFLTTGCWDYRELDHDASVQSLAYDLNGKGQSEITMEIPTFRKNRSAGKSGSGAAELISGTGPTFFDAIENVTEAVPNTLVFSHHLISVFSSDTLKSETFSWLVDRLIRVGEVRRRALMFATSGRAQDILSQKVELSDTIGQRLSGIAEQSKIQQFSPKIDLNEFLYELTTPGIQPILPRLVIYRNAITGSRGIMAVGCAALRGEMFAGWLNGEDTRGVLWVRGESGTPVFTCLWHGERITIRITKMDSRITPVRNSKNPKFHVEIHCDCELTMYSGSKPLDVTDAPSMETVVGRYIQSTVVRSVRKCQAMGTDVFGFGNALYCKEPKWFQEKYGKMWDTIGFPTANIQVRVKPLLVGFGYSTKKVESR